MSGKVTGWVLENSEATGIARLVLIVLADHANSEGRNAWPSVPRIAHEARCSRSGVHKALRDLEANGQLQREGFGENGTVRYRVVMRPAGVQNLDPPESGEGPRIGPVQDLDGGPGSGRGGSNPEPVGGPGSGPEPSEEPSEQQQRDAHANETSGHPLVVDTLGKLRQAGLFVDRFAVENVLVRYVDRPHLVEDALAEVVALAGDPAYRQPKGGAAMMLLRQIRQQGAPPRRAYGNRPELAPAALPDEFAIYNTGLVA